MAWFDQTLADLTQQELGVEARASVEVGEDTYFVDFLRDAPEATGTIRTRHETIFILLESNAFHNLVKFLHCYLFLRHCNVDAFIYDGSCLSRGGARGNQL